MYTTAIILGIVLGLLFLEKWVVRRSVNRLHLRIHVNGTRGKSSVTEYIAAGLSNAQPDIMAKITGVIPTIIHNGIEQKIKRTGVARMQEQIKTIRLAAKRKANSLVLECMSVSPELQKLESSIFRPHIYVITNIKDDHREQMGLSVREQAESICGSIPENCTVITAETQHLETIRKTVNSKRGKLVCVQDSDQEIPENLPDGVFAENIRQAIAACDAAGVDHNLALEGIIGQAFRSGSYLSVLNFEGKVIRFLNAFAVNDVESTDSFLRHWRNKHGNTGNDLIIFNTRADRPLRTDLFARWIADQSALKYILITGDHAQRAVFSLIKAGTDKKRIIIWKRKQLADLKVNLFNLLPDGGMAIGIGNIAGDGFYILDRLK